MSDKLRVLYARFDTPKGVLAVAVGGDLIRVRRNEWSEDYSFAQNRRTQSLARWLNAEPPRNIAIGWASLGDGETEVVYVYDKSDGNFGYGLNITDDDCSEWGYAPFEVDPSVPQIRRPEDYE